MSSPLPVKMTTVMVGRPAELISARKRSSTNSPLSRLRQRLRVHHLWGSLVPTVTACTSRTRRWKRRRGRRGRMGWAEMRGRTGVLEWKAASTITEEPPHVLTEARAARARGEAALGAVADMAGVGACQGALAGLRAEE